MGDMFLYTRVEQNEDMFYKQEQTEWGTCFCIQE